MAELFENTDFEEDFSFSHNLEPSQKERTVALSLFFPLLIIIVVGLTTNALLIYAIVIYHHFQRRIHYVLVVNLALAYMLYLLSWGIENLQIEGLFAFGGKYWWNDAVMAVATIIEVAVILVVSATITGLAVDQYMVIVRPDMWQKWRSRKKVIIASCTVWTVGLLFGLPVGLSFPLGWAFVMWSVFTFFGVVVGYICPILVIIFCYLSIRRVTHLMQRNQDASSGGSEARHESQRDYTKQKRLFALNTTVTIAFISGWGFYHICNSAIEIIWLMSGHNHPFFRDDHFITVYRLQHLILHITAAVNPFLYMTTNHRLRNHVLNVIRSNRGANAASAHRLSESTSTVTSLSPDPLNNMFMQEENSEKQQKSDVPTLPVRIDVGPM